ncbi:unnamed protein product [marine sediment metagenome]|uniref:Uncharacterized protein n=1 Tax=marine sediment metagenome TaxID=412755 RepID=X1JWF9_9ZZZZ
MDCLARLMAILQGMPPEKLRLILEFAEFRKKLQSEGANKD